MSFPFACPNCNKNWVLSEEEIEAITEHLPLTCKECGNKFDLLDGITDFITTDNLFLQYSLRSNLYLIGECEISVGEAREVDLGETFTEIHRIFLTPNVPRPMSPIFLEPRTVSRSRFLIVSSGNAMSVSNRISVSWLVYGNKKGLDIPPPWRTLLSNAKAFEIEQNYRMEIVELESAFEVFISAYLRNALTEKFSSRVVDDLFKHFRTKRMEDAEILFEISTGNTLKEILERHGNNTLYGKFKSGVYEKRNRIVHKGEGVNVDEGKSTFETVFKLVVFLEPRILNDLRTFGEAHESLEKRG